jgi:hypothetical protein
MIRAKPLPTPIKEEEEVHRWEAVSASDREGRLWPGTLNWVTARSNR